VAAISHQRVAAFFAEGNGPISAYQKGKRLEELIIYVFEKIPGIEFYKANVVNHGNSEEVDVAFFNNKARTGFPFLEYFLLVECKNWSVPIGAAQVREFATKLKRRACPNGVLVAANGITGNAQELNAAHHEITMTLAVESIKIIVVTRPEIEAWTDTADVVKLFKLKLLELTVAGSIFL